MKLFVTESKKVKKSSFEKSSKLLLKIYVHMEANIIIHRILLHDI